MIATRTSRLTASLLFAWLVTCSVALPVLAHPLGNTTVNVYERIELGDDAIRIRYVLDVAEIPALQEQRFADTNDDGVVDADESHTYLEGFWEYLQPRLVLKINGQTMPMTRENQTLGFPPGQGGLTLLRAVYDLIAPYPTMAPAATASASLLETTFEGVPGWHEIIVQAAPGASLSNSTVPAHDVTQELTTYPEDRLNDPLSVREATFDFALAAGSTGPSPGPTTLASPEPSRTPLPSPGGPPSGGSGRPTDPLVALIGRDLTPVAMALATLVALGLGALHALSPGHGKTLIAAYLIGTKANVGQALWLGLTVAVTHTAGVFLLGVAAYFATEWVVPDQIVSWVTVATGVLILVLGLSLVWRAWKGRLSPATAHDHRHDHSEGHSHTGGSSQSRAPEASSSASLSQRNRRRRRREKEAQAASLSGLTSEAMPTTPTLRRREVAALGIAGGLIPSGSALLLLLSSVALGQVALGVLLIVAFGVGMALVLAGIATGVVLMHRSSIMRWEWMRDSRVQRVLAMAPLISGAVVSIFGLLLTLDAIRSIR